MSKIKAKGASALSSSSRDLVPVGPRDVFSKHDRNRDAHGERPTTTRALILRNGKYGARGTGELMAVNRMTGREKLDLLAEDLTEKSKRAVASPFRLEQCLKIAESQFNVFLDEIANLQDPDLFYSLIESEYKARTTPAQKAGGADPWKNRSYMASIIATRIHNAYTLASAWQIVLYSLRELEEDGLLDKTVRAQLKKNESLRSRYLVLCDMVNELVETSQAKFSVLATTTPHYARYFKKADGPDDEIIFDWAGLRDACRSFLDSIIIELSFPRAPYPKQILFHILHDAIEESPKEAKRFPQMLWDAVGDLSVILELQDLLEKPLSGPEGDAWRILPREMPEHYEQWVDARLYSETASNKYANFKDIVYPLEKTKNRQVLGNMWKYVNLNYESVSGKDIDTLWELSESQQRTPQWHSYYIPGLGKDYNDSPPGLIASKSKSHKQVLAITNGGSDESDTSMPGLQSVSNSSEDAIEESEDNNDDEGDSDDDESDDNGDEDDGYNTEEEDELREMLRAAMDAAVEAEFFDSSNIKPELDPFQEERKSNPFLKLLGSLRGRMFSSSPKLKTAHRAQPRSTLSKTVSPLKSAMPETDKATTRGTRPNVETPVPQSRKTTVEEVEDEGDGPHMPKKKKKKPKKKKKSTPPELEKGPSPETASVPPPPAKAPGPTSKHPPATLMTPKNQTTVPKSPVSAVRPPSLNTASSTTLPRMSTASLALPVEPVTAQSARSYLLSEKLDDPKTKIKSRPDHGSTLSVPEKKSFFAKFGGKDRTKTEEPEKRGSKRNWFSNLGKKAKTHMEQLLGTANKDTKGVKPMKWEHFLKVMREMGFEYDPSTAGSSVRFDPPDKRDRAITFHKPHPDTTIQPIMLKEFAKRLKRYYGWTEEEFLKQTG